MDDKTEKYVDAVMGAGIMIIAALMVGRGASCVKEVIKRGLSRASSLGYHWDTEDFTIYQHKADEHGIEAEKR